MTSQRDYRNHNIGKVVTAGQVGCFSFGHWLADTYGDAVVPHGHRDSQIMLVTGGSYFTAASRTQPSDPNAMVFNPRQTWHHDRFLGPGSFFAISISADPLVTAGDFRLPGEPTLIPHLAPRALMAALMRECVGWGRDSAITAEALCFELLGMLSRRAPDERRAPAWLKRAVTLLEDQFADPLYFGDVSAAVGVHPVHLTRTFRRFLHCTPGEYLRARRVQEAARLLAETSLSLTEIAISSGHTDQSHLIRRFREVFGMTPGAYRAQAAHTRHHVCSVQDPAVDAVAP